MRSLLWPVFAALLLSVPAQAQVLITEVQPNPNGSDDAEWIEIHNTGTSPVVIDGWILNDFGPATPRQYAFGTGTTLAAGQVIIVARQATAYIAMAVADSLAVGTPHYELASGADDAAVPNLAVVVSGSGGLALGNSGDGVQLSNAIGTVMSTAEWGNGRAEVPGSPSAAAGSGQSIGRIANTGSSDLDFAVQVPNPGTGFSGPVPTPPTISGALRSLPQFVHGSAFTLSADVVDADGVGGVEYYFATATSPTGNANGAYVASTAVAAGNNYSVSGNVSAPATGLTVPAPTAFNQQYIRYFVYALDNNADEGTAPASALTSADNPNYYWENVLPATGLTAMAIARAQDVSELPVWDGHSVRVEGIALTGAESFQTGRTNFYIADGTNGAIEAIRVFDDELISTAINPGDRVTVTGKIGAYRGVRQLGRDERGGVDVTGPEITVQVAGTAAVPMHTISIAGLLAAAEQYESSLVEISNVSFSGAAPGTWPSDANVDITDGTGTLTVRVIAATDLANASAPTGAFTLRGILSQFAPGGTGGYQLQPRSQADVLGGGPPVDGGVMDSGVAMDAGSMDAVVPPADTGVPPADTGVPPADTGVPPADTGVPPADTGVPPADTGVPAADTGVANMDSGMVATDGGVTTADTGVKVRPDSGVYGGAGGERDSGGCTCARPSASQTSMPLMMLAGLAVFWIRRRR